MHFQESERGKKKNSLHTALKHKFEVGVLKWRLLKQINMKEQRERRNAVEVRLRRLIITPVVPVIQL